MTDEEIKTKMQVERLRNVSSALYTAIIEKYKILPLISTLSAALAGLLFQDSSLIKMRVLATFSFIIFLLLIPLSIFCLFSQLERDTQHLGDKMEEIVQNKLHYSRKNNCLSLLYITLYLFSAAIILLILSFFSFS